ncbi:MAG: substrate-binding domain-containing protein [Tannerella sp.]|jgi:phosphate transport system substrate-binding protein|nr:substrate-binding domain-containing protein [Tannerella sp.]
MKKILLLLTGIALLANCTNKRGQEAKTSGDGLAGTIQLSGAFALYPMAVRWGEEFRKIHPDVKVDISGGGAGKGMTDALSGVVDIGMVSREVYPEEIGRGAYPIATVKDAVIPVVNANNPEWESIRRVGLTKGTAAKLWSREVSTWGEVTGTSATTPVHVFTRSDACGAAETFAAWFGRKQEHLKATAVFGDPGLAAAVQKDRVGIGYNNVAYAYDQKTKRIFDGLAIIPIDVNENGRIDPEEDFYETTETLIEAISAGRYPSPPARDLYLVTKGKPTKPEVIAFLEYVLTEGQQYAGETGYIGLAEDKLQEELTKLR